jgi:hypothetical protein
VRVHTVRFSRSACSVLLATGDCVSVSGVVCDHAVWCGVVRGVRGAMCCCGTVCCTIVRRSCFVVVLVWVLYIIYICSTRYLLTVGSLYAIWYRATAALIMYRHRVPQSCAAIICRHRVPPRFAL